MAALTPADEALLRRAIALSARARAAGNEPYGARAQVIGDLVRQRLAVLGKTQAVQHFVAPRLLDPVALGPVGLQRRQGTVEGLGAVNRLPVERVEGSTHRVEELQEA